MKKLNSILHSKLFFLILILITILFLCFSFFTVQSKYQAIDSTFSGKVISKTMTEQFLTFELQAKEKLLVRYSLNKQNPISLDIGDEVFVSGILELPSRNRNFSLFNYQEYLKGKHIFWIVKADQIRIIKKHQGFDQLKSKIIGQIETRQNASYLFAFLLGDSSKLERKSLYQELGISHLFAVSGMHILFLSSFLFRSFKKICEQEMLSFFFCAVLLGFYIWLLSSSVSANRAYLLFLLSFLNKHYKWNYTSLHLLIFVFVISVFKDPFSCLQIGFQFSFLICLFLMLQKKKERSYFKSLLLTSAFAFLVSFPLTVYHFHQIHLGTIFFNLFAVPFVSFFLFPLSFLSFFVPILDPVLSFFLWIFHIVTTGFQAFGFLKLIFQAVPIWFLIGYYIILFLYVAHSKKWLIVFLGMILIHFLLPYYNPHYWIDVIDIGQGDAVLIRYPQLKKTILVDCGGRLPYQKNAYSQVDNILIPYFKAVGVKKIDVLILTHGDSDHMGNALELIHKFSIKQIIMNSGADTSLEEEVMKNTKIPILKISQQTLLIGNQRFQFLNSKNTQNENEDSLVFYTKLANKHILFMGDAGEKSEKEILLEYNFPKMDILKVGHHGSKTSSTLEFLNMISPKVSLISAGVNNSFGHPHKEVVFNLEKIGSVYSTNEVGSIRINLNQMNKIQSCLP